MPTAGSGFNWSILFLMAAPYAVVGAAVGWLVYQYGRAPRRQAPDVPPLVVLPLREACAPRPPGPMERRGSARVLRILPRRLRLRRPRCGRTGLYAGWFAMHPRCAACGLRYEREQGYFVGAIYINYAVTVGVAAGAVLALDWTIGLTLAEQLALGIVLAALVPLAFFR